MTRNLPTVAQRMRFAAFALEYRLLGNSVALEERFAEAIVRSSGRIINREAMREWCALQGVKRAGRSTRGGGLKNV